MESKSTDSKYQDIPLSNEEVINIQANGSVEDNEFDRIVEILQEAVFSNEFIKTQDDFCNLYCSCFDDGENLPQHMEIFQKYTSLMDDTLSNLLAKKILNFNLSDFEALLLNRQDEICGEIFDLLVSMTDYEEFKQLILSYKSKLDSSIMQLSLDGNKLAANHIN